MLRSACALVGRMADPRWYSSASYIGTINITNPITNTNEAEILKGLTA
jgi:hypothetical protein